jgi:hypothetical protein
VLSDLDAFDKIIVTMVAIAVAGIVHALAYTTAEGALRPQRILLMRSADVLAVAAALFVVRVWLPD